MASTNLPIDKKMNPTQNVLTLRSTSLASMSYKLAPLLVISDANLRASFRSLIYKSKLILRYDSCIKKNNSDLSNK